MDVKNWEKLKNAITCRWSALQHLQHRIDGFFMTIDYFSQLCLLLFTQFRKEIYSPSTITIGHIDECHYVSTTALQSNASISMCSELTNDTQSSINKHFIMSIYAVCFSVIKSCTYSDSSTLQALYEHACLFYEKCNADHVGKIVVIL